MSHDTHTDGPATPTPIGPIDVAALRAQRDWLLTLPDTPEAAGLENLADHVLDIAEGHAAAPAAPRVPASLRRYVADALAGESSAWDRAALEHVADALGIAGGTPWTDPTYGAGAAISTREAIAAERAEEHAATLNRGDVVHLAGDPSVLGRITGPGIDPGSWEVQWSNGCENAHERAELERSHVNRDGYGAGRCYDCGEPATYTVPDAYGPHVDPMSGAMLRCTPCAARDAAEDGERIRALDRFTGAMAGDLPADMLTMTAADEAAEIDAAALRRRTDAEIEADEYTPSESTPDGA